MNVTWVDARPGAETLEGAWWAGDAQARERLGPAGAEALASPGPARRLDAALAEALARASEAAGASARIVERLRAAARTPTRFVVTGQQPGPLGGPLMTRHKVAMAAALARFLEARDGGPVVPLYWMGADDDDFDEIRGLDAVTDDLAVVSARLPGTAHEVGVMVGSIDADAVRRLWEALAPVVAAGHGVAACVARALEGAVDLAGIAARLVVEAVGGEVGVVDARCAALRRAGAGTIRAWLENEDAWRSRVAESGEAMRRRGWGAQIAPPGRYCGAFRVRDDRRERVPVSRRESLLEALTDDPAAVAPGVVLRNLLQDAVIGPAVVVLGPAEIAYRAQIAPLYAEAGVRRPAVVPRLAGTWLPAAYRAVEGVEPVRAAGDVAAFLRAIHGRHRDETLAAAARDAVTRVEAALDALAEAVSRARGDDAARRAHRRLDDVRRRVMRAAEEIAGDGRAEARRKHPFLAHAGDLLRPGGVPQERRLWLLAPTAVDGVGAAAMDAMADEALDRTLDGAPSHAVYSV